MDNNSINSLLEMRIIDMTGEQFVSLINASAQTGVQEIPEYVSGVSGLARLLKCSDATAWRLKKSGKIDAAIHQYEKTVLFDTRKVLELLKKTM